MFHSSGAGGRGIFLHTRTAPEPALWGGSARPKLAHTGRVLRRVVPLVLTVAFPRKRQSLAIADRLYQQDGVASGIWMMAPETEAHNPRLLSSPQW